jgi:hypothetical protein
MGALILVIGIWAALGGIGLAVCFRHYQKLSVGIATEEDRARFLLRFKRLRIALKAFIAILIGLLLLLAILGKLFPNK